MIVDRQASPWVTCPIFARSNTEIIVEPHTTLLARRGEFISIRDYLFSIIGVTNVTLRGGEGSVFRMWRDDYFKPPYEIGDWRYALSIRPAKNVLVEGIRCEYAGGDGICIAANSSDVTLRRCVCDQNTRQGLTIGSGVNILVEDCVFSNTRRRPPQAGVDIEPDSPDHHLDNIVLRNCLSVNNAGSGYEIAPNQITAKSRRVKILFDNCRSVGNCRGIAVFGAWRKTSDFAQGCVQVKNCTFSGSREAGICVSTKPADMFDLVFEDCVVSNSASKGLRPDVEIGCRERCQAPPDNIVFRNLRVFQNCDRPWLEYADLGTGPRPSNIAGDVTVTRADGDTRRIELDRAWRDQTLKEFNRGRPFKPLSRFDAASPVKVRDACPGKPVTLSSVSICFSPSFVFYMEKPGRATFTARQVIAAAGRAPSTNEYEITELSGAARRWKLPPVSTSGTSIDFDAPASGFYRLKAVSPGTRVQLLTTTVPVAVDLTQGGVTFGAVASRPFSVWFEVSRLEASPTLLLSGNSYYRFAANVCAPDGKAVSEFANIDSPETIDLSASLGLWRVDFKPSSVPRYDWVRVQSAAAPDCLFLSTEKIWLRK